MNQPAPNSDLANTPRWRVAAVTLWAGFVGAVLLTPVSIWATSHSDGGLSLITRLFIANWIVCCVPALMVWVLAPQNSRPNNA